tara:strand:+ start:242 stop:778 length:537 start_codon:yes stop_codon:yes gene_type:complete
MKIKYEIDPIFRIEFFKIECIDFKNKKKKLEESLSRYPEMPFPNFKSNRNKCSVNSEFREIFKDEFSLIKAKYNSRILLQRAWSVVYNKGDYHIPHNHGSTGYCGILYLDMKPNSPNTTYIQPWNDENDKSVLYSPEVKPGDMVIVPQSLWHYSEPNKISFKKRILSFDFILDPLLSL